MPVDVEKISKSYMNDPIEITVGNKNVGAKKYSPCLLQCSRKRQIQSS